MFKNVIVSFLFILGFTNIYSQNSESDIVQFSGVVVSGDSLTPIPYSNVIIKNTMRGTSTDYYGYFSFVAMKRDTIEFSAIGYSTAEFVIPDTLSTNKYSLIQLLSGDTIELREVRVFPWPSKEAFKQAFLNLNNLPDDMDALAAKNTSPTVLKAKMEAIGLDPSIAYKQQLQQYQSKLYYAGQAPPINILNPIAWAKFIEAWKNGDFKKQ